MSRDFSSLPPDDMFGLGEAEAVTRGYVCAVCHEELAIIPLKGDYRVVVICPEHGSVTRAGRIMRSTVAIEMERAARRFREVSINLSNYWGEKALSREAPKYYSCLARIRKGERDENGELRDLSHFRVVFRNHKLREQVEGAFRRTYGEEPKQITVCFAYDRIERIWSSAFECYRRGALFAKCAISPNSGELRWSFLRDVDTSEILVSGGSAKGSAGQSFLSRPIRLSEPVYHESSGKPVFLVNVGRLEAVIPEIASITPGYFEFRTTLPADIAIIERELDRVRAARPSMIGVHFHLRREEQEVERRLGDGTWTNAKSWMVRFNQDESAGTAEDRKQDDGIIINPTGMWAIHYAAVEWNIPVASAKIELNRKFYGIATMGRGEFTSQLTGEK